MAVENSLGFKGGSKSVALAFLRLVPRVLFGCSFFSFLFFGFTVLGLCVELVMAIVVFSWIIFATRKGSILVGLTGEFGGSCKVIKLELLRRALIAEGWELFSEAETNDVVVINGAWSGFKGRSFAQEWTSCYRLIEIRAVRKLNTIDCEIMIRPSAKSLIPTCPRYGKELSERLFNSFLQKLTFGSGAEGP